MANFISALLNALLVVKELLKSVQICQSNPKMKVATFLRPTVYNLLQLHVLKQSLFNSLQTCCRSACSIINNPAAIWQIPGILQIIDEERQSTAAVVQLGWCLQFHGKLLTSQSRWLEVHVSTSHRFKTVVTWKIKHLQRCFTAVDFPRICRGVKMFYFTCNHLLSSSCFQHAETFAITF